MNKTNILLLTFAAAFLNGGSLKADQVSTNTVDIASGTVMYSGLVFPGYFTNTMSYIGNAWASNGVAVSGWNATSGGYYIDGVAAPSLTPEGNGFYAGNWYANGTLNGWNADSGYILNGVLVGDNQGLDHNGTGTWNGQYYLNGQPYPAANNNGYDATSGNYYVNGQIATLTSAGNGMFNGLWYANGTTNGWNSDSGYVLNGVLVGDNQGLDHNGTGTWSGQYYLNGQPYSPASSSGYDATSGNYYVSGQIATLTSAGNGMFNSLWYANGTTNGWNSDSGYVLNGVLVGVNQGLDQNGTGSWSGSTYVNGVLASTP